MQISRRFINFSRYRFLKVAMRSHNCGRDDCGLVVGLLVNGRTPGQKDRSGQRPTVPVDRVNGCRLYVQLAYGRNTVGIRSEYGRNTVGLIITHEAIGTGHDGRGDHHRGTEEPRRHHRSRRISYLTPGPAESGSRCGRGILGSFAIPCPCVCAWGSFDVRVNVV